MENNSQLTFWQKTRRFFEPVLMRKFIYLRFFTQSLFIPLTSVISILFLESITHEITQGNLNDIWYFLVGFLLFAISAEMVIYSTKNWGWMVTLFKTMDDMYSKYLRLYIRLDGNKTEQVGSGKLVGILHDGVFRWSEIIADLIIMLASLIVGSVFTMYMIGRVHFMLPLCFIFLFFIFGVITFFMNKKLMVFRSQRYEYKNLMLQNFVKVITSKNEILQTGKLQKDLDTLSYYLDQGSHISKKMSPFRTLNKRSAPFLLHLSIFLLFVYIIIYVVPRGLDFSFLVGLSATFILMQKTIGDFVKFYTDLNKQMVSVEKLWDFFDSTPQIQGYDSGNDFHYKNGDIKLESISYSYDEGKAVFRDFSLDITGGKVTALVGPSGGGKTTLVKLISGYIRANSGEVVIDNQKLSQTSLKSFYQSVGYLTQEPSVFDGSVRENLMYSVTHPIRSSTTFPSGEGKDKESVPLQFEGEMSEGQRGCKKEEGVSDEKLHEVITLANCEFIYDLVNGVDTEIGERGVRLSGGQKQRLAIAKIFLKDPKIIILDEPTSALDSVSEKKITDAMHNLFKGRTVIIIAHRLQTVKYADEIIVIEDGAVRERGKHTALLKKNGYYKEMLDLQSGF